MRMTKNNVRLVNASVSLARAMGVKLYLDPSELRAFRRASTVELMGEVKELCTAQLDAIVTDYMEACKGKAISIDFNSVYGGYKIEQFMNEGGGVDDRVISSLRESSDTLATLINTYLRGFSAGKGA